MLLDHLVDILEGGLEIAPHPLHLGADQQVIRFVRSDLERLVDVGEGLVRLPFLHIRQSPSDVGFILFLVALDGRREETDCFIPIATGIGLAPLLD